MKNQKLRNHYEILQNRYYYDANKNLLFWLCNNDVCKNVIIIMDLYIIIENN